MTQRVKPRGDACLSASAWLIRAALYLRPGVIVAYSCPRFFCGQKGDLDGNGVYSRDSPGGGAPNGCPQTTATTQGAWVLLSHRGRRPHDRDAGRLLSRGYRTVPGSRAQLEARLPVLQSSLGSQRRDLIRFSRTAIHHAVFVSLHTCQDVDAPRSHSACSLSTVYLAVP